MTTDEQIQTLQALRYRIAAIGQTLAERELTGRVLRLKLETEERNCGATKTDAEKAARVHAQYLEHERHSIQLGFDREMDLAEAEAVRLRLEFQLVERRRTELTNLAVP